ncbi:unnamed protein product [Microthlaspi erraticum]|uniref:C2H2-type domain-containing protein n=1 Tax=Microthlaspi erraticum TaxID=1685480 RepID=A0A6D2J2J2_9BRAS|nr:unnamed protein product [Microthlaspi erraticum]
MDPEEEINENSDDSDYVGSDIEEGEIREIVLALPAMSVSERLSAVADEEIRKKAVAAADLVVAAAQEAAVAGESVGQTVDGSGEKLKRKLGRPRKVKTDHAVAAADGASRAGEGEVTKKPRKKGSSVLTNPPKGPPRCNICRRNFGSWKAVFGHLRSHKNRGYHGFLPPPSFNAAEEGFGGTVAASSSGGGFGFGTGGLGIDLNADPVEEGEKAQETGSGSGTTPKFDLNRSPPQDGEEEEKEDKAE